MSGAAHQAPGISQSSFSSGLMRQGVKKHHGKDLWASQVGGMGK